MSRTRTFLVFTVLLCLFLSACVQPPPPASQVAPPSNESIPFTSLIQSETPGANQEKPVIYFAGSRAEAEALAPQVNDAPVMEQIMGVDFDEAIAVVVFRGQMPSTGYGIAVKSLTSTDNGVVIQANLTDPSPDQMTGSALTFPSDVVKVNRKDLKLPPGMSWNLMADGQNIAQAQYPR